MAETSDHYFSPVPGSASSRREIALALPDRTLRFVTDRGVFAGAAVDAGTKLLLLEASPPAPSDRNVVDLGCGYGPVAITLALRAPWTDVWAVEVNARARELCDENAARAGVADRVHVRPPDDVPSDLAIDRLYSNPPIRIGKPALHDLLAGWLGRLAPNGAAYLVIHKNLGADSLATWLAGRGYAVSRVAARAGYRVLEVKR